MAATAKYRQAISANLTSIKARLNVALVWLSEGQVDGLMPPELTACGMALAAEYDVCMELRAKLLHMDHLELVPLLGRVRTLLKQVGTLEEQVLDLLHEGIEK